MHIAAASPRFLNRAGVDEEVLAKEAELLAAEARANGKKEAVIEKIVQGRLHKFCQEFCLLDQSLLVGVDAESKPPTVRKYVESESAKALSVEGFTRFQCGEGVEKEEADYAAEVEALASS